MKNIHRGWKIYIEDEKYIEDEDVKHLGDALKNENCKLTNFDLVTIVTNVQIHRGWKIYIEDEKYT